MTATAERSSKPSPRDLRLPGSTAEIAASPPGPRVGAFFDLDGTLVAGYTGAILTQDRVRRREVALGELFEMVQAGLNLQLGRIEFEELIGKGGAAMRGHALSDLDQMGERLFGQKVEGLIYPEMRELVRAHLVRGHTVVLSSSALTIQVEPVARFLGVPNTLCNRFETDDDGLVTGEVIKPVLWGPGKASAVQQFAIEHDVDLTKSYFYADGDEDVALMYLVGHPRPTNPKGKMAAVAKHRGWPVLRLTSRGNRGVVARVRQLVGVGSVFPLAAGAVGLGVITRSKRRGINLFLGNASQLLLSANGVRLNVIGKEHLTAQRPAMFIFNHRNQVDPLVATALVRENVVGVGKKELARDPIMGTIGKLMDTAFIDRDDTSAAVDKLHEVEERARSGLSVIMSPEGTRVDTTEVGLCKKGAFRVAMAAGIPIVPIVIRNPEIIAARNSMAMNPGTVDVAVFPPISVDDWTLDELSDRIAEVRQLFLDALVDWPVDVLPDVPSSAAAKKSTAKKSAAKKGTAKKSSAKKGTAKKSSAKKGTAKKPAVNA